MSVFSKPALKLVPSILIAVLGAGAILQQQSVSGAPQSLGLRPPIATTVKTQPDNVNSDGYAVSDTQLVYSLADLAWTNVHQCSVCTPPVIFTKFRVKFYDAHLHVVDGRLVAAKPHVIFTESKGWNVSMYSDLNGWVVYDRYHSYELDGGSDWQLIARNIATGRRVIVDDPEIEGAAFNPQGARSDGRTVVFTAYAKRTGGAPLGDD